MAQPTHPNVDRLIHHLAINLEEAIGIARICGEHPVPLSFSPPVKGKYFVQLDSGWKKLRETMEGINPDVELNLHTLSHAQIVVVVKRKS